MYTIYFYINNLMMLYLLQDIVIVCLAKMTFSFILLLSKYLLTFSIIFTKQILSSLYFKHHFAKLLIMYIILYILL